MRSNLPPPIDKFSLNVIEEVMREVELEINQRNANGFGEHDNFVGDSYDNGLLGGGLDEGNDVLGMGNNDGQLIGNEKQVKEAMAKFREKWGQNLQQHCKAAIDHLR